MISTLKPALLAGALAALLAGCSGPASTPGDTALAGGAEFVALVREARALAAAGDLAAAGTALDRAMAAEPDNPALWVEIARLRFRGGEHIEALAAAERAVELGPEHGGALLLRAQLVRDAHGLVASLPWYEAATGADPDYGEAWLDYAATLGDLGHNRAMLRALDALRQISADEPRANFLTAVLAARAGNGVLARSLLERSGMVRQHVPAALLLDALLSMGEANYATAAERLEALSERQPDNARVRELLARALLLGGREAEVTARFGGGGALETASPYLAMLVGRAHERLGERDKAASWLERASAVPGIGPRVLPLSPGLPPPTAEVRTAALAGDWNAARARAASLRARFPGSADVAALAGDAALGRGDALDALELYAAASKVRRSWPLARKAIAAYRMVGDEPAADVLLIRHVAGDPQNLDALLMLAGRSAEWGDWARVDALLDHVAALGGSHDPAYRALRARAAAVGR